MSELITQRTDEELALLDTQFASTLETIKDVPSDDNGFVQFLLRHRHMRLAIGLALRVSAMVIFATFACTALAFAAALVVPGYWGVFGVMLTLSLLALFFSAVWLRPIIGISTKAQQILTWNEIDRRLALADPELLVAA